MICKKNFSLLFILLLLASYTYGQSIRVLVPYDGTAASYLVAQIKADTAQYHGIPADRVYMLQSGGLYLNTEIFNVMAGQTVRLKANGDMPIIYQYPTGTGSNPQRPPGNLFVLQGGNLEMTNIAVSGYFEPVDTNFNNVQGGLINTSKEGSSIYIDHCLLTNINGQHIRTGSAAKVVKITNTIFANMGALSTSNFGAGKGLDLREVSIDSLILVNNTFVNYQDRAVRHYNFTNPLAGTGGIGYCLIDHNSFVNGMGFHGLLSLGNLGGKAIITNNLFKDGFAAGEDSTDATRTAEWGNTGEFYPNGLHRMCWIFNAPDSTTQWTVSNNYYAISPDGQAFFNAHTKEPITAGQPLSWHINKRLGADSTKAFTKVDLTMAKIPKLMTAMMEWYVTPKPAGAGKTKNTPGGGWTRAYDMDRRPYKFFIDTMDCSYGTTVAAYTGAEKGFPAGDLNWYPTLKALWDAGGSVVDVKQVDQLPTSFTLEQNYPNPFNPTTKIAYSVPKESKVKLEIFDILGRSVETLVNQVQKAGNYSIEFNATKLTSGIYFYRLSSPEQMVTKKMLLMK